MSARKAPEVHPKPGYALGEETRTGTGPRNNARQRRQQPRQADPPTLDSGPTTTASAATIDSSTEDPTPDHDPGHDSRTAPRPATAPQSQDSGRPAPTPDDSAHTAQDAHRTRYAPPYYYIYTHHRRQPDSGPRWTSGPTADTGHNPRTEQKPDAMKPLAEIKKKFENTP